MPGPGQAPPRDPDRPRRKIAPKPTPVAEMTTDPLTNKRILDAVKCSRCFNVIFEAMAQPVILPGGAPGFLCVADREKAGIKKRSDKPLPIIVCARGSEAVAASIAVPVRVPTDGDPQIVHLCATCYDLATKDDAPAPKEA